MAEGTSKREAIRCLKRYIAREVCCALMNPTANTHEDERSLRAKRAEAAMTQEEVAAALGTDHIRISEIEREASKRYEIRDRYSTFMKSKLANLKMT